MFIIIKTFLSGITGKITLGLSIIMITIIGVLYLQNSNYQKALKVANDNNVMLSVSLEASKKSLADYVEETQRLNAIAKDLQGVIDNAQPVIVERIKYVKQYKDNPNIVKCELSSEWVRIYNMQTDSPYRETTETNTR